MSAQQVYMTSETEIFSKWLKRLKDIKGKVAILRRIQRAEKGNFGDHKSVGENVLELRIDVGPGYRVYFTIKEDKVVFLLCGGSKDSQKKDIAKAHELIKEL